MFTPHRALITGGAGFIGCNLAACLASDGCEVLILDDLSRQGSAENLRRLRAWMPQIKFAMADVSNAADLLPHVKRAEVIYHLAAQTAVTTSLLNPMRDFKVNAEGTINVLESASIQSRPPIVFYASTNKVYGDLADIPTIEEEHSYRFDGEFEAGISEEHPINLQTPYGCSKGAGDLYALDYASSFGLRTVVFRQSCIYGPWQNGTEDQGWVYHFLKSTFSPDSGIRIYGNGKQVRDLLYIDDLIRAIALAVQNIKTTAGQAYNIGGGADFALSINHGFWQLARPHATYMPTFDFKPWRKHDQCVYISDVGKARRDFGWMPTISPAEGISRSIADLEIPF